MDNVFNRYSRQIFIEEVGGAGQKKIMSSKVLVVGAGGLGSPVIQYLAAAGVGTIAVVDFDHLEIHNLNRQVIHKEKGVGCAKVISAAAFVQELNSHVHFVPLQEKVDTSNIATIMEGYDIIIDGSDNFTTRYTVNDYCVRSGKVLVYGSIYAYEGQMAVFNYKGSKHLRDLFPEPPDPRDVPSCDRNGVLGPLPGMVGAMMAMQALKIIVGLPVDVNQLTIVDTLSWTFSRLNF